MNLPSKIETVNIENEPAEDQVLFHFLASFTGKLGDQQINTSIFISRDKPAIPMAGLHHAGAQLMQESGATEMFCTQVSYLGAMTMKEFSDGTV